jgi:hypothetical protein
MILLNGRLKQPGESRISCWLKKIINGTVMSNYGENPAARAGKTLCRDYRI